MPDAAQLLCSSAQLQRHRSYMFRLHTACSCLTLLCLRLLHLLPEILELMQWGHHLSGSIINILFFLGKYSKHGQWGIKSLKSMVLDYKWSIQHFVLAVIIQIGRAVGWKSALEPIKVVKIYFVSSARELLMHTCLLTEAFVPGVQWRAGSIPDDNHLWQTFLLPYSRC